MKFRGKGSDEVTGFLDTGTNVTGELEFTGTVRIDGCFHGSIATDGTLVIGEHGVVHADIKAGEVEIHGQVFGSIETSGRAEIFPTGRVRGDIHSPALVMSLGAMLDGRVCMAGDRPDETTIAVDTVLTSRQLQREGVDAADRRHD